MSLFWTAGSQNLSGTEGEVKVRKKPTCRLGIATAVKNHQIQQPEGGRRSCGARSKEPRWGSLGTRGSRFRKSMGLATFPTTSERLKRATRKSTILRGTINKVKWGLVSPKLKWILLKPEFFVFHWKIVRWTWQNWIHFKMCKNICIYGILCESAWGLLVYIRCKKLSLFNLVSVFTNTLQSKGRAVSRLLESFAADEGFQMDGSSFSEEDDSSHRQNNKSLEGRKKIINYHFDGAFSSGVFLCCLNVISVSTFPFAAPNCVLTKEFLTDGLKVLISKEDELLYAARVHSLEIPDMWVISQAAPQSFGVHFLFGDYDIADLLQ